MKSIIIAVHGDEKAFFDIALKYTQSLSVTETYLITIGGAKFFQRTNYRGNFSMNIPLPAEVNNLSIMRRHSKAMFGKNIIDCLIFDRIIDEISPFLFLLENQSLGFLAEPIENLSNSKWAMKVDELAWERKSSYKTYLKTKQNLYEGKPLNSSQIKILCDKDENLLIEKAQFILTQSKEVAKLLSEIYRVEPRKVIQIPLTIQAQQASPDNEIAVIKNNFSLDAESLVLFFWLNGTRFDEVASFLKLLPQICRIKPKVKVVLYGNLLLGDLLRVVDFRYYSGLILIGEIIGKPLELYIKGSDIMINLTERKCDRRFLHFVKRFKKRAIVSNYSTDVGEMAGDLISFVPFEIKNSGHCIDQAALMNCLIHQSNV